MEPSSDIARLLEIMAALRDRRTGCPWDAEQTFRTIAPYTIEEAYEVADAIERDDLRDLRDELGDLLLQVVFHAQMASELGAFAFGDVVLAITRKMIRRHPHVFGDERARSAGMAKSVWNEIKAQERAERATERGASAESVEHPAPHLLDSVPAAFPALTRALKLQEKAATVGFDWGAPESIIAKIEEEVTEFRDAVATEGADEVEAELGDVLFSVVNLCRHLRVDPEAALRRTNEKFRRRFAFVESGLQERGRNVRDASLAEMEDLWSQAKGSATR